LTDGKRYDLSDYFKDYDRNFFENNGIEILTNLIQNNKSHLKEVAPQTRWGSPLGWPSKLICIGLNYESHALESGMDIPKEPIIFFKSTSAICGPFDNLKLPRNSHKTDWEVELAFVIGKKASYVSEGDAMDYVAGYLLHNDYSEREFQLERGGQWVKGKSCDTFAPLGPWFLTKDEMKDPHDLHLWTKVNGNFTQKGNTSDLIFNIPYLVHYLSQFMTLIPGDIISTGTPFGVGMGFNPPIYLKSGDFVEIGIDGLGNSSQKVV
jgi:2-keto-4-pentenoate hydratase/2-oxohepta-3-ene-1,7-dioic acid hydratase in catechol pathway